MKNIYIKIIIILFLWLILFTLWYVMSWKNWIPPHYHTNFALFIGGERFSFTADEYSEDVAACNAWWEIFPRDRVHLHENNWDTIHVHDWGVTWGHFFANNGITFSNSHISFKNGKKVLYNTEENSIKFVLNGKIVDDPFNRYMISEDKLLISYGSEKPTVAVSNLFPKVISNAHEYNDKYDPGSCWWTNENWTLYLIKKMLHFWHH